MNGIGDTLLFKKVYGCVMGGAFGDAMGGPTEGKQYEEILNQYGWVTDLLEYSGLRGGLTPERGRYTDDTRLACVIYKAIIEKGGRIRCEDLADMWMKEFPEWRILNTTSRWPNYQIIYWRIRRRMVPVREVGNCLIPGPEAGHEIPGIGIINACDPRQAAWDAYEVASMIHSGVNKEFGCAVAAAIAEAMKPDTTIDKIVKASTAYLTEKDCIDSINKAVRIGKKCKNVREAVEAYYKHMLQVPLNDPREVVACGIGFFYVAKGDPVQAAIGCTNFGRDGDTLGEMACAIAGACKGIDAIPKEAVETIRRVNSPKDAEGITHPMRKIDKYPTPDLKEISLKLTELILKERQYRKTVDDNVGKLL